MKGIDIAGQHVNIDFQKLKNSGIEIVYIKATEGLIYNSPLCITQYNAAKATGLKIGFYHYLKANDPILEAKHFLSAVKGLSYDCKYGLAINVALKQTMAQISSNVRQYADYIISSGKEICIYTGDSFYLNNLDSSVKNIPLWVAHYGVVKPDTINYIGFQHSNSGILDGINALVNLDEFSSDIFINSERVSVNTSAHVDHVVKVLQHNNHILRLADKNEQVITKTVSLNTCVPVNLAVSTFQRAVNIVGLKDRNEHKLVEDGIKGKHTYEVIYKILINRGTYNELVCWMQQRLITLGFSCGKSGADTNFGWNTLVAVQHFQGSKGLKTDGIVRPIMVIQLLK